MERAEEAGVKYLAVKNWEHYQHYHDRRPPWIKLHQSLLDDHAFLRLSDANRSQMLLIWLIASRHNNRIPNDARYIAHAIQCTGKLQLKSLIDAGFLYETDEDAPTEPVRKRERGASPVLARDERGAMLEKEREKETETELAKPTTAPDGASGERFGKLTASPEEAAVLAHYRKRHPRRRPGEKDLRAVRKGLGFGYAPLELCRAIDGNADDPWHRENRKHDLDYVLRNNGLIDNAIAKAEAAVESSGLNVDPLTGLPTFRGMRVAGLAS